MFFVTIKTDNAAFTDYPMDEIARILRDIATKLEGGTHNGKAFDINGNSVGKFEYEETP